MLTPFTLSAGIASLLVTLCNAAATSLGAQCSKSPYKCLVSFSAYAPAQSYCSQNYPPVPATTTTVTTRMSTTVLTTTTVPAGANVTPGKKRDLEPRQDSSAAAYSKCSSQLQAAGGFSRACSCIQSHGTSTTTVTGARPKTITSTITETAANPSPACANTKTSLTAVSRTFSVHCQQSVNNPTLSYNNAPQATTLPQCIDACLQRIDCCAGNFDTSINYCEHRVSEQQDCAFDEPLLDGFSPNSNFDSFELLQDQN